MDSLERFISSQKLEIEHLKSTKEELNNSLKEANQTLGELLKLKVRKYMQAVLTMRDQRHSALKEMWDWSHCCRTLV